jgi:protein-S-isoprenylcysteine O-methyltransferase
MLGPVQPKLALLLGTCGHARDTPIEAFNSIQTFYLTGPASRFFETSSSLQAACRVNAVVRRQRKWLFHGMNEALRLSALALFAVGPVIAVLALLRRGLKQSATLSRIKGWRWYVPVVLLPVEWLLPPALIALHVGEIEAGWLAARVVGLAVGLTGAALLVWASVVLGRFMMHEAAIREDHALIESGPYRFVRHPVYTGYLALLLGSGVASLNVCLLLLWPVSLLGILMQAAAEEQLLGARFGRDYERYVGRIGRLVPRCWSRAAESDSAADGGRDAGC